MSESSLLLTADPPLSVCARRDNVWRPDILSSCSCEDRRELIIIHITANRGRA